MSSIVQEKSTLTNRERWVFSLSRARIWELLGVSVIVALAAWLRFSNLDSLGYANHYYTAGVKSMLQSWHNFFFVSAEPGGSVTIDKPPVGLWLQAISAYFLGLSGFSVLLPELIAGTISVVVLYHLVRRSFGTFPGLLAALVLAITPVVVATDRNNTIDSTLILTLLLATWAFVKATETSKLRYLLLGALLVGIGFNIKMLQAYLPLPAFYALYFLGASEKIWPKLGKLAVASILLFTISFSWSVAVDLTPTDQRPYVGSSSDNSETNLILGYNGINRLLGMFGRRGNAPGGGFGGPQNPGQAPQRAFPPPNGQDGNSPANPPGGFNNTDENRPPFNGPGNNDFRVRGNRGGGFDIGTSGPLRLFIPPLSKETSWLLPFGMVSLILLAAGTRWTWPFTPKHQALVLWGGWLVTCVIFFSVAGFFHEYYLSMMGAPLAALVAIGIGQLWNLAKEHPRLSAGILAASAIGTLASQMYTASVFVQTIWWLPTVTALLLVGLIALTVGLIRQNWIFSTGFSLVCTVMLVTPGIWSVYTNLSASQNQSLPSAYSGRDIGPVTQRSLQIDQTLLSYLQANTANIKYLMAVPSSMQGADYIIATGRPVLYMGGFMGQDDVVSAEDLAHLVNDGELRFIYWDTNGRGPEANSEISTWIASACTTVKGFETSTQNAGAPDGTGPNAKNRFFQSDGGPIRNMSVSLYDCGNQQ
jgi:4-amino-4-deoxy-L-arabinose transferase-like glycosyltransferase